MKQKIFSLLVMLVVAVTGAWAQFSTASGEVSSKINTKKALKAPIRRTGSGDAYNLSNAYLQYSTEEFSGGVGTGGGAVYWGIRFPAADLAAYDGQILTQVGIFMDSDGDYGWTYSGNYTVRVYQGGDTAPGTLVSEATEYLPGDFAWHDITLTTPVEIDVTQDLWLTFYTPDIAYPMSGCTYTGNPNSDFLSLDGSTWEHVTGYSLNYTWMIRGVAAAGSGYALIKADDAEVHGTVQFNIGEDEDLEEDVSSAEEGDKVTVIVTPEDGYMVAEVTGEWQAAIARAPRRAAIDMMRDIDLQFVSEDATTRAKTYTFEMIRADAEISCTYKKLLTHPDITVDPIANQTYNGNKQTPSVTVKDDGTTLVRDVDYTVEYENNIDAGTATVTITAVEGGNYSGSIQTTFTILQKLEDRLTITVEDVEVTYTGDAIEPQVVVKDGALELTEGKDYTITYENNTEIGTAVIIVTGIGNYSGTVRIEFVIALPIDEEHFPDDNFRAYMLKQSYGDDAKLVREEIDKITRLYVQDLGIKDLSGVKYLTALQYLNCHSNLLTTIDLSNNKVLNTVLCQLNDIAGEGMDALIASLPQATGGKLYAYDASSEDSATRRASRSEANAVSDQNISDAKAKGWTIMKFNGTTWEEMTTATGVSEKGIVKSEEFAPATRYDLQGRRVSVNAAFPKGVYIQNGRKVVVK